MKNKIKLKNLKKMIGYKVVSSQEKTCFTCSYSNGVNCRLYEFCTSSFGVCNSHIVDQERFHKE